MSMLSLTADVSIQAVWPSSKRTSTHSLSALRPITGNTASNGKSVNTLAVRSGVARVLAPARLLTVAVAPLPVALPARVGTGVVFTVAVTPAKPESAGVDDTVVEDVITLVAPVDPTSTGSSVTLPLTRTNSAKTQALVPSSKTICSHWSSDERPVAL